MSKARDMPCPPEENWEGALAGPILRKPLRMRVFFAPSFWHARCASFSWLNSQD